MTTRLIRFTQRASQTLESAVRVLSVLLVYSICLTVAFAATLQAQQTLNVPDEYPTITAAIDAAFAGDIISIAAGVYDERLTVDKNLTFIGAGEDLTILQNSEGFDFEIMTINSSNVVISNLRFQGYPVQIRRGIVANTATLTLRNCKFIGIGNYGVIIESGDIDVQDVTMTDSPYLLHSDVGISVRNSTANIRSLTGGPHIDHIVDLIGTSV